MKIIINVKTTDTEKVSWSMDIVGFDEELRGHYTWNEYGKIKVSSSLVPDIYQEGNTLYIWGSNFNEDREIVRRQSLQSLLWLSKQKTPNGIDLEILINNRKLGRYPRKLMEYINS